MTGVRSVPRKSADCGLPLGPPERQGDVHGRRGRAGALPTADAKFDLEKNALQLAIRLDEGIRNALADVTPAVITDASLTHLRIDNLADLEVQRPQNLVHGLHVFRMAGFCMVLSDDGAKAYFENAMGTRFELEVDEVISKQLFKAHTAEQLEGGDYKLVIKSRAGDAAGPLQTATKRVKYLKVADPTTITNAAGSVLARLGGGEAQTRIETTQ